MKRVFFLYFTCEEGKITSSRLVLKLPRISSCCEKLLLKTFCNSGVSLEIVDVEYIEDENAKKRRRTGRTFSESGRRKETSKQIYKSTRAMSSTKYSRNVMPNYQKNGEDYEPNCLKEMQASQERYLKSKAHPQSIIPRPERSFLAPEKSWKGRPENCESRAKESDQTDPEV